MDAVTAREMYKEHILDLYKHPHNFGSLDNATHSHNENNPLCGDDITIHVALQDNTVNDVRFEGKGCAISMAAASLVTDKVKGLGVDEVLKLQKDDVLEMLMIPIGPVRLKCALLALEALHKTVQQ